MAELKQRSEEMRRDNEALSVLLKETPMDYMRLLEKVSDMEKFAVELNEKRERILERRSQSYKVYEEALQRNLQSDQELHFDHQNFQTLNERFSLTNFRLAQLKKGLSSNRRSSNSEVEGPFECQKASLILEIKEAEMKKAFLDSKKFYESKEISRLETELRFFSKTNFN